MKETDKKNRTNRELGQKDVTEERWKKKAKEKVGQRKRGVQTNEWKRKRGWRTEKRNKNKKERFKK